MIELAWGQGGLSLKDYERRCESERRRGADVPRTQCSLKCARRILVAASEVEYEKDRELLIPNGLESALGPGRSAQHFLMKSQVVDKNSRFTTEWSTSWSPQETAHSHA